MRRSSTKTNKPKLVIVEWNDAHAGAKWYTPMDAALLHEPMVITWIGFVQHDTDKGLSLSFGYDEHGNPCGNMFVPKGMIRKITKVKY